MSAWTEDAIERLRELHARRMSASKIADALNGELGTQLTRNAVCGKLFRLGLTSGVPRPAPKSRKRRKRKAKLRLVPALLPASPVLASDADIPLAQRRTLLTLENQHCRWPVGEVGEPGFFFCGHPSADVLDGRPYCAWHARRAFGGRPAPRPAQAEAA
jgi:GcrA cell cycle regulator